MVQMIFEKLADGTPAPRLPMQKGQPLTPDGVRFFNLPQAVEHFGRSVEELRDLYQRTFGELFGDLGADEVGTFDLNPQKLEAARLEYLRVDKFGHLGKDHFNVVLAEAQKRGLDIGQHIWAEIGVENGKPSLKIIVKIDALRLIAERTGRYTGQTEPKYLDACNVWHKVWIDDESHPLAARVGVRRLGFAKPLFRTASWRAYAQYTETARGRELDPFWQRMGAEQLAKCAEALALRTAFPQEMAGLYCREEMMQAKNPATPGQPAPQPQLKIDTFMFDDEVVIDETTPETQAEFDAALAALGFNTPESRRAITSQLKQKFTGACASPRSFYAMAIRWLKRSAA